MSRKWDQGFPLGPHLEFLLLPFILSLSLFFAYFEYDFGRRYIRSKEAPDACFFFTFTACFLTRKDHSEEREHTQKKWERKKEIQRWNCAVFRPASFKADREPHTHSYPSVSFLLLCRYFFEYLFYTSLISLWPDESAVRECVWLNGIEGSQWRRRSQDFLPPPSFSSWRPCWLIRLLFSFCYFGFFCAFPSTWNKRSEDEPGGSTSSGRWFANG